MWTISSHQKGEILCKIGEIITQHWYIENGLLKGSLFDEEVNYKVTVNFLSRDMFLFIEAHRKKPISVQVEVMEDTIMYTISAENFNKLKQKKSNTKWYCGRIFSFNNEFIAWENNTS